MDTIAQPTAPAKDLEFNPLDASAPVYTSQDFRFTAGCAKPRRS